MITTLSLTRTDFRFRGLGVGATRLDACALNLLDGVNISSSVTSENLVSRLDGLTLTVAAIWDPGYVSIEGEASATMLTRLSGRVLYRLRKSIVGV